MNALQFSLFVSALIFSCGIGMALSRRNAIMVLIGIELMMNAANINFIAFWRFVHANNDINGIIFVIFSIAITAAEAAVGLAIIISIYRQFKTTDIERLRKLKG